MANNGQYRKPGPYRSRSGMIFGVCKGLADYFNFRVFWVRAIGVLILIFSGVWPIVALYILLALLIKPEPVVPFRASEEREFYDSYTHSRSMAIQRLKKTFDNLDRRLRRVEDRVTGKEFDWERRFHQS